MTDGLVKRIRTVFEDTPEVASWLEQDGDSYDYDLAEARTHMLGMWETMQVAADRIEAQAAEIERLREALLSCPLIARYETAEKFRERQDDWLANTYRAAIAGKEHLI